MKNVKISLLVFLLGCATLVFAASDSEVNTAVKNNITNNKSLSELNIEIMTQDGVVSLSGLVNSDDDAVAIIETTQATAGVKDVDTSKLSVKDSKHPFEDTVITAKVKGTYLKEELFGKEPVNPMKIKVDTIDGVVHLSGAAKDQKQAQDAIDLAKKVKGVKDVVSKIEIEKSQ